jgi:hypothetical protein
MKNYFIGKILLGLALVLAGGRFPCGAAPRNAPAAFNLIIDGSAALSNVLDEVAEWISGELVDRRLQEGDRITVWSAGNTAEVLYSGTLRGGDEKAALKKILQSFSAKGDKADFSGALREARERSSTQSITYTLLVSASASALSPTLLGPQASLVRFSRVEEFRGWRALVVGLNIDSQVRRAVAAYFSGT